MIASLRFQKFLHFLFWFLNLYSSYWRGLCSLNYDESCYSLFISARMQALDMIRGKNIILLMDSHLEGKFSMEDATVVVNLASQCLQNEPRERPNIKDLITILSPQQPKSDVRIWNFSSILFKIHFTCTSCHSFLRIKQDITDIE